MQIERVSVGSLISDPNNARKHGKRSLDGVKSSLSRFGQQKPLLVDGDNKVLCGNGTLAAARNLGWKEINIIRTALKGVDAVAYALADNKTAELSEWYDDVVWDQLDAISADSALFDATGFTENEMENLKPDDADIGLPVEDGDQAETDRYSVFPCESQWGVTMLDINMQAMVVTTPVRVWGSVARSRKMLGTWVFYTDDYRFYAFTKEPDQILGTGCAAACECNYTIAPDTPRALALYAIYQKRWLNRYWQSRGVKTIVDMFGTPSVSGDLELLGVPQGWGAYSTRGGGGDHSVASVQMDYDRACIRCGKDPHLFLVYGGNLAMRRLCELKGWIWVEEYMQSDS